MNCEQSTELMADYLVGALVPEQMLVVEEHLRGCGACAADLATWKKMAVLPMESPSAESRERFEAMLHAYPSSATATSEAMVVARQPGIVLSNPNVEVKRGFDWSAATRWLRSPMGAVAWSVAVLVMGVLIGAGVSGRRSNDSSGPPAQELAEVHAELNSMRQLVALSMLQQQSASERLQGVTFTNHEEQLDPQVYAALLHTLRYDTSVDVRLAALDALSRHAGQPQVRKSVVDSLQTQQSPMVQVAMIDLLTEWRDPDAAQRLRNFQQSPNLNPTVRQRAQWAVSKLQ
jgi:HEAT repeats/Putative zinc-finger